MIRQRGGVVVGAVSKSTDFVVAGRDPGSNKLRDAEKHGVAQIDEPRLVQMLGVGQQKRRAGSSGQPELF